MIFNPKISNFPENEKKIYFSWITASTSEIYILFLDNLVKNRFPFKNIIHNIFAFYRNLENRRFFQFSG